MSNCTNFPKDNLVPNVTQHQVGNVTYLYKGGAPTAPIWEAVTLPIIFQNVDQRFIWSIAETTEYIGQFAIVSGAGYLAAGLHRQ